MKLKIERMHELFGEHKGKRCRECEHFCSGRYHDRLLYKCEAYGLTHSESSDWVGRYDACGLFNRPYNGHPVIRIPQAREPKPPLPGQIGIADMEAGE